MTKQLSIVFYLSLLQFSSVEAQTALRSDTSFFFVSAQVHAGFILPHTSMVKNLVTGYVHAVEINWIQRAQNLWDKHHHHHGDWGLSLYCADLGNPDQLGQGIGLYPFYNFPIIAGNRIRWMYRVGGGPGYLTRIWDRETNYKNIMIGSHLNAILSMHTELEYRLFSNIFLYTGLAFTHFSNGAVSAPNLGINNTSITTGLSWRFKGGLPTHQQRELLTNKGWTWHAQIAAGTKQIGPADNRRYFASSASIESRYRSSRVSGMGIMGDLFYNTSLRARMAEDSLKNTSLNIVQSGIMIAYEASVGRWMIIVGNGAYIYSAFKGDGSLYHRIGTRFQINKTLAVNMTLKTHWFKADFIETGINIKIR